LAVFTAATAAFGQGSAGQPTGPSYQVGRGKIEVAVTAGAHAIGHEGLDENDVKTVYAPGADAEIGGGVAVGITRHFSVQVGLSMTKYKNDLYWRPAEPHNPYLATANLFTFNAGVRYDIRRADGRVRPYVGGGLAAAHFASVERGPSELCFADGSCLPMPPELFTGTRFSPYFDGGVSFFVNHRWGLVGGMKILRLQGSGTAPAIPASLPTGKDTFWHEELYGGLVLRVW
jgi:outer membrane protein W